MKPFLDRPYGRRESYTARPNPEGARTWRQPEELLGTVSSQEDAEYYARYFRPFLVRIGLIARRSGKPLSHNPYCVGSPDYVAWREGWLEEQ